MTVKTLGFGALLLVVTLLYACEEEVEIGSLIPVEQFPVEMNGKAPRMTVMGSDGLGEFHEGLAVIRCSSNYGYIDKAGRIKIEPRFARANRFSGGLASVTVDSSYAYIDKEGTIIIELRAYDVYAAHPFSDGLARIDVRSDTGAGSKQKSGYIDRRGNWIVKPIYTFARDFSDGLAAVGQRGKWGFIDSIGQFSIPPKYAWAGSFSEGLATVRNEHGLYGCINRDGSIAIPLQFPAFLGEFREGLAPILVGHGAKEIVRRKGALVYKRTEWKPGHYGYISKRGEVVIPIKFSKGKKQNYDLAFHDGLSLWAEEGWFNTHYKFIDRRGNVLKTFDYAFPFSEGLAVARADGGKVGFIDTSGSFVIKPEYDSARGFFEGSALVKAGGRWLVINRLDQ